MYLDDLPKISIVMPSLNQARYIEEAILSVVEQDYPGLEFLVIDGGSTDGTLGIIEKYKDRIDCFISEPDRCQNHAVNKGLLLASGDYIGWLNSDDKYELGAIMKVGQYLSKHPDVDLLYGDSARIDASGKLLGWHRTGSYDRKQLFYHRDIIPTQACFFRRECLAYVGLLDCSLRWNGDWDLWRRIATSYKVVYLDEHIGNWRIYHGTISYGTGVNNLARELETIRSARKHSDRFLTPIELRNWPWVVIDFFRLRPVLRRVRKRIKGTGRSDGSITEQCGQVRSSITTERSHNKHLMERMGMLKKRASKYLALIPARGGSKGIPKKNTRPLMGKPLITHTIEAALQSRHRLRVVVSTDDEETAKIAQAAGAEIPFLRPAELAQDDTPAFPVVLHALQWLKQHEGYQPEVVVLLQPTSPLRRAEHIDEGIKLLLETNADSLVSVCEVEHSPYWMRVLDDDGRVKPFVESTREFSRRQDLPPVYRLNGALYVTKRRVIMEEERLLGDDVRALIMSPEDSIDIDDKVDFLLAELLLKRRLRGGGM